jgi:AraC-like DNA-binding protein
MDTVSHLLHLAHLDARLDKRCLLSTSTRMDVAAHKASEVPFHILLEGTAQLQVGGKRLDLKAGDVVLIPTGAPHRVITSGTGRERETSENDGDAFTTTRSARGGDPVIDLFCGHYTFGAGAGTVLLRSLPDVVHVSFGGSPEGDEVLHTLSVLMRAEARREGEGTAVILAALCTVILAMVLRTSRGVNTEAVLWTAAADSGVAEVVEAVLNNPRADWSIERLSRAVNMSRATFLRRFTRSTGMTVGSFVARARLMAAAELLTTTGSTVAAVAGEVGYNSESAFTRAFREEIGTTPSRFRRSQGKG